MTLDPMTGSSLLQGCKGKGWGAVVWEECIGGVVIVRRSPYMDKPLCVMHGQCVACLWLRSQSWPRGTLPAFDRYQIYCLVTEAHGCEQLA